MAFAYTTCYKDHGYIYALCSFNDIATHHLSARRLHSLATLSHFSLLSFIIHDHNYRKSLRTQHLTSVATAGCRSFRKCNRL